MASTPRLGRRWCVCGLILLAACTDRDALAPSPPVPDGARLAMLECRVSVRQATLTCVPATPNLPGISAARIIGEQDVYVKLASSGTSYDGGTETLQSNVTVQNLVAASMGTANGVDPTGIRVFFNTGPTVTSGTGIVTLNNADGTDAFTGSDQPYFLYNEILTSYQISAARQWIFNVPATVNTFAFTLYVAADVQNNPTVLLDAVWDSLATSTDWDSAGNWVDDAVPDSNSVVAVPSASHLPGGIFPVLNQSVDVTHLRVGTGSTLGLATFTLRARGNVDGTGVISNGTVWMSGTGALLKGSVPALEITGSTSLQGSTTASGPVSVTGTLTAKDQPLNISIP
ncbi:MAG TPA: hypothetical protein VFQ39_02450 [Longimicrobium sp.]|nr:hypothetical protein [Longimicrobium sp.]